MTNLSLNDADGGKGRLPWSRGPGLRIAVVGTGHVGLTTCVTLPELGHKVVGVDADAEKIRLLKRGQSPFYEPRLAELLKKWTARHRLRFVTGASEAIPGADVVFICVGTPGRADGEANLVAVEAVARDVARHATGRMVVVEKSTVPAGTAQRIKRSIRRERPIGDIEVVSNPEFLREGNAVRDTLEPDRILIGADSDWAFEQMRRVYDPLVRSGSLLVETDIETAELSKHACNAFLAMKISYANALARICERSGADVEAVTEVMGADPRIGPDFLDAGLGYGGYCFPKDVQAFERLANRMGYEFGLLREVARINDEAVEETMQKIRDALWNVEGKRVALLGLSFKPGTDDIRLSPALKLAGLLIDEGATVIGYDPRATEQAQAEVTDLLVAGDAYEAAAQAHCVVLATAWEEFRQLDLVRLRDVMAYPVIVDGRNLFDPKTMEILGFTYYPTGRAPVIDAGPSDTETLVTLPSEAAARGAG